MGYLANCRTGSAVSTRESCRTQQSKPRKLRAFEFQELARATDSFSTTNILGKGSHACVYKAVLDDGQVVAVKRPTIGRRSLQDISSFDNELDVLSRLEHRHLVNVIGYCSDSSERMLVVEFMGNGTLFDLLHVNAEPLSWSLRVHMACQAAKAILALHSASPPIIHRDVKSSNILIDSNWNAKLGDLGLAVRGRLEDVLRQSAPPAGTMGYIDPQYETPSQLSAKSDVFSFGILLLELISGRNAIDVRFNPSSIVDWAVPLIRQGKWLALCDPALKVPPRNSKAVKQLAAIAARSVRLSRDRRPTMDEVVEGLREIRRKLPIFRFGIGMPRSARNSISSRSSSTSDLRSEVSEGSFSDGASSIKSETTSTLDEGRLVREGSASPAAARSAIPDDSHSHNHSSDKIRWKVLDSALDSDTPAGRQGTAAAAGPTGRTFDINIFLRTADYAMKVDMPCGLTNSSVSKGPFPRMSANNNDEFAARSMSRRSSAESPTFELKQPMRSAMISRTTSGAAALGRSVHWAKSVLDGSHEDKRALDRVFSYPRASGSRIFVRGYSGSEDASLEESSGRGPEGDRSQFTTSWVQERLCCEMELSPASDSMREIGMIIQASEMTGASDGDNASADSDDSSPLLHPGPFIEDFSPIWVKAGPSLNCAESHFEKVDLPIAV